VRLGDRPGDEETQPCPGCARRPCRHGPPELLEDEAALVGRHARAVVGDLDTDARVLLVGADTDLLPGRRVLDRVLEEVRQHLLKAVAVAAHVRQVAEDVGGDAYLVLRELEAGD
jgi:hypothetical protein